jgi:hypothetical protein
MTEMQEPVPVYSVKNAYQAEIIKSFLQSEGIACSIEGEGQIGLAGILDIRLLVRAADADLARKLIKQHEQAQIQRDRAEEAQLEAEEARQTEATARREAEAQRARAEELAARASEEAAKARAEIKKLQAD